MLQHPCGTRVAACVGVAVLVFCLVGCGRGTPVTPGGSGTFGAPRAAQSLATQGAAGAQTSGGAVTLSVDRSRYAPGDTILARLHNGLGTAIYSLATHTDCSPFALMRQVNGAWQPVGECAGQQPRPQVVSIKPGGDATQPLAPATAGTIMPMPNDGGGPESSWPAGTYRVGFVYVTDANQPFAHGSVVYSASFVVA